MVNGNVGMSGHTFDAFVSSQRTYNEPDWAAKIQEKYWRARQKFLAKIERKEDSCIVLSDSKLDSKLEIFRSIDQSCDHLTDILESYQNCLFVFANEENALGILLKECGKHDATKAGKVMSLVGKSLTQSSRQRIRLYMPLLRLYQEMETFHSRAVEDTANTVDKLESKRAQYRSSLLWMKDVSEKLNPDVYRQLDKFRRVQNKVRDDKKAFDGMQMDVVQKIDLLMASRCNLMNQILAPYQEILLETFEKNHNNFRSVEEIIKGEDLYEYEFKTLKQLNPLKINDDVPNTESESGLKQVQEQDLIGQLDDNPPRDGNNNQTDQEPRPGGGGSVCAPTTSLIDVDATEEEVMKSATRPRINSLVTIDEEERGAEGDELAKSLDLLDSLFGSSQDATEEKENGAGASKSQSKQREDKVKAIRSNLNASLLDVDGEDETRQVASLLGMSEQTTPAPLSQNRNKEQTGDPLNLLRDDIFSKWAKDAGSSAHDETNKELKDDMALGDLDQDLMDLGGATMPKATTSKDLDDFLA